MKQMENEKISQEMQKTTRAEIQKPRCKNDVRGKGEFSNFVGNEPRRNVLSLNAPAREYFWKQEYTNTFHIIIWNHF